jgi:hypothetical protein
MTFPAITAFLGKYTLLFLLSLYTLFMNVKIWFHRRVQNVHRYHLIYLEHDTKGLHTIINNERVYLEAKRAQPGKGIRSGNEYFTTKETHEFIEVEDNDF